MYVELLVGNESGTKVYQPVVQEGIEWSTERKNTPGKLVFKVLYDNILDFSEGSPVRMKVDGDNVFFGFVFKQQRTKDKIITVTAYDQLRYLKNKDTKVYEGKTANQFVKMIADDYALNLGTLDDTGYVIESRVEENTSLFEMIANALDLTLTNTGEMYVLYDDFGKLTLKSLSSMYVGVPGAYLMIDEETGQNFDYTSSIDENTYNKIKLTYDNKDTGKRDVYITQDSSNINKWGILQYFDTLQKGENGQAKVKSIEGVGSCKVKRVWNGDIRPADMIVSTVVKNWYESIISTVPAAVKPWLDAVYNAAKDKKLTVGGTVHVVITDSDDYGEASSTLVQYVQQTLDPEETAGEGYGLAPIGHVVSVASASPVSIEVKTTVTFEEGHNWSNTKAAIAEAVDAYFLELRKNWSETSQTIVRVSQIENRILGVDGVVDVTGTKLNGTASNMTLTEFCIPKLGGVSA